MSELSYPHGEHPSPARTLELALGVHWLSMPMGGSLSHINLYLLDDGDGWYVVDTGLSNDGVADLWRRLFAGAMGGRPVKGVICTHMHPDHTGQAGMITERFRCPLYMTQLEYLHARLIRGGGPTHFTSWQGQLHFQRAGMDETQIERMRELWRSMTTGRVRDHEAGSATDQEELPERPPAMPGSFERLGEGDTLEIGGHEWRIIVGSGHSPEHACLYCRELGVLISGDQILPVITSNVSVQPTEPEANPLEEWLRSHERFLALPPETFVLPAHNLPFYGLHVRLNELIEHHEHRMLACEIHCRSPRTAVDLLPVLFKRRLEGRQVMLALGEVLAHLNLLRQRRRIERSLHEDGVYRYRAIDPTLEHRLDPRGHEALSEAPMLI